MITNHHCLCMFPFYLAKQLLWTRCSLTPLKIIFISYTLKIIDGKKKNSSKKRIQKMKPLKIERMVGSKRLKQLPTLVFFSL